MNNSLKKQIKFDLKMDEDQFSGHERDLYILESEKVWKWLNLNYKYVNNITRFFGTDGKWWLDIPFEGDPYEAKAKERKKKIQTKRNGNPHIKKVIPDYIKDLMSQYERKMGLDAKWIVTDLEYPGDNAFLISCKTQEYGIIKHHRVDDSIDYEICRITHGSIKGLGEKRGFRRSLINIVIDLYRNIDPDFFIQKTEL